MTDNALRDTMEDERSSGVSSWMIAGILAVIMGGPALWVVGKALFADKPEIAACEKYILGNLRSPSTYKRISVESTRVDHQQWVRIVYDADNAFGTPLRESELCKFRTDNGLVVVPHVVDPDLALELRRLDELTGRAREPCCLD